MNRPEASDGLLSRLMARRAAALPYHGLVLFFGQILLVVLVAVLDRGEPLMPKSFAGAALVVAVVSTLLLGYRRLAFTIAAIGAGAMAWVVTHGAATPAARLPVMSVLVAAYGTAVYLSVNYAFTADLRPSQRILCGAASFVMIGFLFSTCHAFLGFSGLGTYSLPADVEGNRLPRWVDYLWLSFSTLTTAGFGDMVPVGTWPCTLATLEGLCGILYPATLIARIAALPAAGETKQCW